MPFLSYDYDENIISAFSYILITGACRKTNAASNNNNNNNNNNNSTTVVIQDTLNDWIKIPVYLSNVDDIWFTTPNKGFLINGSIYIQLQIAANRGIIHYGTNQPINGFNLQFVDSLNGFVQGNYLLATSDGGKTWAVRGSTISGIYFQFINPLTGFYFGLNKGLFITHDGGNSWVPGLAVTATTTTLDQRYPFYFLDSLRGFSMMNGNFYTTSDGGVNWNIQANITGVELSGFFKMQFLDEMTGYCGTPGGLLKTTNGGKNWINCFSTTAVDGRFSIPRFFDTNNGYLMTTNGIYKTTNGGQSW